jgi:FkbH-like protein
VEDFLHSLSIEITVSPASAFTIPRIAQLTQRTNQFNLTTRRYTESKIQELAADAQWIIVSVSAVDAIGDAGIVGAALIHLEGSQALLDTFLMSCRVLGRGIEDAFLAEVQTLAKRLGASSMVAEYIPTKKNAMAKDFLAKSNFTREGDFFIKNLDAEPHYPQWIKLHNANS